MRQTRPRPEAASRPARNSVQGARQSKTRKQDIFRAYLAHHRHSAADSLHRLLDNLGVSLMTWLVIAIAVALPATLYTSLQNVRVIGQSWDGLSQLSVFIKPTTTPAAIDGFRKELEQDALIGKLNYVSAEQALAEFEQSTGLGRALQTLDNNPLPPAFIITPVITAQPEIIAALAARLKAHEQVDDVVIDLAWVQRMQEILALAQRIILSLGLLLALGVLLVIGNTIRLAIENRRDEILVIKLVGGTNAFVRRPFLYTGVCYGVGGGIIACVLLALAIGWLSGPVGELAALYQSDFRLQGLGLSGSLVLVLLAALIGWAGAWLAVSRHLGQITPH